VKSANGATLGFEQTLWQAAEKMRGDIKSSQTHAHKKVEESDKDR